MTMVEEVLEQAQWDQEEQRIHPFFFRLDQIIGELKNKYLELCKEKEIELLVEECEIRIMIFSETESVLVKSGAVW